MFIYGVHPVEEILRSTPDRAIQIYVARKGAGSLDTIRKLARDAGVSLHTVDAEELDEMARGGNHQGVVLEALPFQYAELDDVIEATADRPRACVVVLEQVQDPGNLGAILRSAAAMGVDAVVIPKDRAVGVTSTVVRASAGMAFRIPVARVVNVARTLDTLKEHGYWAVAAAAEMGQPLWEMDFDMKTALVMGGEHQGIRRLVQDKCDFQAFIPMAPAVESLNVASAATVFLYEIRRQWRGLE